MLKSFWRIGLCATIALSASASAPLGAQTPAAINGLRAALTDQTAWLGRQGKLQAGNDYLALAPLQTSLRGPVVDANALGETLRRWRTAFPQGEPRRFARTRQAIEGCLESIALMDAQSLQVVALIASKDFTPKTTGDVEAARAELQRRVNELDTFLAGDKANAEAWGEVLALPSLKAQLAAPTPDQDELFVIADLFADDITGLEMAPFQDVREALLVYLRVLEIATNEEAREDVQATIEGLFAQINQHATAPTEETSVAIQGGLDELEWLYQTPYLVRAVRRLYSQNNFHAQVSERLAAAGIARSVAEQGDVNEMILGTHLRGTSFTQGELTVSLVPSDRRALLETIFHGRVHTSTYGVNGPARLCSKGTTCFTGRKQLAIDVGGFTAGAALVSARTNSQITDLWNDKPGLRGRIVQKVASKRAAQNKPASERIAADRAETRIAGRMDRESTESLARANREYRRRFIDPLSRRKLMPDTFRFRSSSDQILVTAMQEGPLELGAPRSFVPPATTADLAVQFHPSVFNNSAAGLLAGKTFTDEDMRDLLIDLFGKLPEKFAKQREEEPLPWSITFNDQRPMTISVDGNVVTFVMRGDEYTSGDRDYEAMNVTVRYQVAMSEQGLQGVRQGEIEIYPPDFVHGEGKQLPARIVPLKRRMERLFADVFPPTIQGEGISLAGNWAKAGKLKMTGWKIENDWIAAEWRLAPIETVPAVQEVATTNVASVNRLPATTDN